MVISNKVSPAEFAVLYTQFQSSISSLDCGSKCSPYNENGVPFCCDPAHAVPTAYEPEWVYLQENTDLWRPWQAEDSGDAESLQEDTPDGQVLISCQGHKRCQRGFRSITCRAFPFFPYITSQGDFIGLSVYWEYEDRCWVISNLQAVQSNYRAEFSAIYDTIFERFPAEKENFARQSELMRQTFASQRRSIPLLHRNGDSYKISAVTERLRRTPLHKMPKFGPYAIAALLPFPDEIEGH
jgi:hypothetical protein